MTKFQCKNQNNSPEPEPRTFQSTVSEVTEFLKKTITDVLNEKFDGVKQNLPMGKARGSGLTKTPGIYLIYNSETKRVYLGSSADLSQRKGEHRQSIEKAKEIFADTLDRPLLEGEQKVENYRFLVLRAYDTTKQSAICRLVVEAYPDKAKSSSPELYRVLLGAIEKNLLTYFLFNMVNAFFKPKKY
jgi:hypothetical protein